MIVRVYLFGTLTVESKGIKPIVVATFAVTLLALGVFACNDEATLAIMLIAHFGRAIMLKHVTRERQSKI